MTLQEEADRIAPKCVQPEPGAQAGSEPAAEPMEKPVLPQTGPIPLTAEGAILVALENNEELRARRLTPLIRATSADQERAAFDPILSAQFSISRTKAYNFPVEIEPGLQRSDVIAYAGNVSITELFPTGTKFSLEAGTSYDNNSLYPSNLVAARTGVSVTQSLLRGAGIGVNLVSLRQARLDTQISEFEFRGYVIEVVAQVEEAYWDYALAIRQVEIFESSLKVAEEQLNDTNMEIQVGKMPETERAAAQAEVAKRREDLIGARAGLVKARLKLLRLVNPGGEAAWTRDLTVLDKPFVPTAPIEDVESHVQVALRLRPELNQARLNIQRDDLEIVKTKNGLLPKLDFFLSLGTTGYATELGDTFHNINGENYDLTAGVKFEQALLARAEQAQHGRALLSRQQAQRALDNLAVLVQEAVRDAYVDAEKTKDQVGATAVTREARQEALRVEKEKFGVGRSTSFLVAQAERDFISSQIDEVLAVVNHLKALVELYRLEGSLLDRRGISMPGPSTAPESPDSH